MMEGKWKEGVWVGRDGFVDRQRMKHADFFFFLSKRSPSRSAIGKAVNMLTLVDREQMTHATALCVSLSASFSVSRCLCLSLSVSQSVCL